MSARRTTRRPSETTRGPGAVGAAGPATFLEHEGALVVRAPGLFRPGREAFGRRLAREASRKGDVRRVRVCLASGTCRLDFAPGRVSPAAMADRFADSVAAALAPGPADGEPGHDRGWIALTVFPAGAGESSWETVREGRGDLRLRHPSLRRQPGLARRVARELRAVPGVASCRTARWSRDVEVRFDPASTSAEAVVSAAEDAARRALAPAPDPAAPEGPEAPAVVTGLRRAWYLALAGGAFGLTLVALVVPGLPTVPFLLATSYYLVRSSPALNRRLLRSRFFGPILADLQTHGGLRPSNKVRLLGLTAALGAVVLVVVGTPAGLWLVVVASFALSVYAISRIPGIPHPARPALAGPSA